MMGIFSGQVCGKRNVDSPRVKIFYIFNSMDLVKFITALEGGKCTNVLKTELDS